MAQAAVGVGTRRADREATGGRTTALFKAVRDGLSRTHRASRDREEMGCVVSMARVGRETGVKC